MGNKQSKSYQILFRLAILLEVLWGARAWITWEFVDTTTKYIVYLVCAIASYLYFHKYNVSHSIKGIWVIAVCMFFATKPPYIGPMTFVELFLRFYPVYVLACDIDHVRENIIFLAKSLSIIIVPGLILHIIMYFTGIFPGYPIQYPDMQVYLFFNYGFLLKGASFYEEDGLRFQSIFLEPGYLGTLMAFMLYALQYDFKKKTTWILTLALFLSFSLAGWMISIFGYILHLMFKGLKVQKYFLAAIIVYGVYIFGITYNDGDNYINEKIISRLEFDEDKGIVGNNRTSLAADDYFERYWGTEAIFFGIGDEGVNRINGTTDVENDFRDSIAGAGYKIYFIKYGIFSAIMIFLVYYIFAKSYMYYFNRKYILGFLGLLILTFIQAAYPATYSWLIPFVLGVQYSSIKDLDYSEHEEISD